MKRMTLFTFTMLTLLLLCAGYLPPVLSMQRSPFYLAFSNRERLEVPLHKAGNDAPFEEKLLASIPSQYKEPGEYSESGLFTERLFIKTDHFSAQILVTFEISGGGWAPILSPDKKTVAYRAKEAKKEFIVIGDQKGEEFDEVRDHVFSPDGSTIAYRARINKRWFMVCAEQKGAEYDKVGPPSYSPDGKKVAYGARNGKVAFIVDGNQKGPEFERVSSPVYSPEGDRLAYVGYKNEKSYLVVGGKTVAEHRYIGDFTFAPKGGSFAYSATSKHGKWFVVVGDKPGKEFLFVYAPPSIPMAAKLCTWHTIRVPGVPNST